jgi:outer membrane protein assembly factor BamB
MVSALVLSACAGGEPPPSSFPGLTVVGDGAYLASNLHVYKFDPANGAEAWRFPFSQEQQAPGPFAGEPMPYNDVIVVGGAIRLDGRPDNKLYALSAQDGRTEWLFTGGQKEYVDGVASDGKWIYAPNGDNNLYVIDPSTMNGVEPTLVYTFTAKDKLWTKPLVANGKVYLPSLDHNLYILDAATGKQLAVFTASASIASTPALKDGVLYFGSFDRRFYAIDAETGTKIWESEVLLDGWVWCDALIDEDQVFVGDVKGRFYAFDTRSGKLLWSSQLSGPIHAQPVINGNKIYVVSFDTYVYSFDRRPTPDANGNVVAQRVIENGLGRRLASTPAIADGLLLVPLFDGDIKVTAIDLETNQKSYDVPPKPAQ